MWGKVKDPVFKPNYSSIIHTYYSLSIAPCTAEFIIKVNLVLSSSKDGEEAVSNSFMFALSALLYALSALCLLSHKSIANSPLFLMRELELKEVKPFG